MNAICLVIDRLHAGFVGAYGNAWIETPSFDRLASQSVVFDQALIDSPRLASVYRSYWQGWHALCAEPPPKSRTGLAARLREAGVASALLSDEPEVARHPLAVDFDDLIEIDPQWQPRAAAKVEQTHFAKCFVPMIEWLESAKGPFMLWCHLAGLGTTWDAPRKFREAYCEEGDPPPPAMADVPDRFLPPDHDPDELLGVIQAYAGQVTLLDTCLGALLEFLDSSLVGRETLLLVTSPRGFPLGEHRRVGPCDDALFGELVHVPWMMRFPEPGSGGISSAGMRRQTLIEPADLCATLLDWWKCDAPHFATANSLLPWIRDEAPPRERLCIRGNDAELAIRTPAWYLRMAEQPELFVKPDDRWEANNVAMRCEDVVSGLQAALAQCELSLPTGRFSDLPPLSERLLHGLE